MEHNSHLQIKPKSKTGIYHQITPASANWEYLNFEARLMAKGETWQHNTEDNEMVIVLLSGNFKVESDKGNWETKNGRKDVFSGVAHTLYLSRNSTFTLTAMSDTLDIGYGWCKVEEDFPAKFVTPEDGCKRDCFGTHTGGDLFL